MTEVLIVGCSGTVGNAVWAAVKKVGWKAYGTTSKKENVSEDIFYLDLKDRECIEKFVLYDKVDHILITSGKEPQYNLSETNAEHIQDMFDIHVIGPMLFLKRIIESIRPGGSITFLSSPAGFNGSYDPAYSAVKGAINSLTKTLAKDLAPNIRVNALSPSVITGSPVFERMTPDFRMRHLNNALTKAHTTAEQCADSILFLMSSKQITGQVLQLSGGMV